MSEVYNNRGAFNELFILLLDHVRRSSSPIAISAAITLLLTTVKVPSFVHFSHCSVVAA